MSAIYQCGNSTNTISGHLLYLLIEDWTLEGYGVAQTAEGYAVTFPNGYVRTYNRVG